MWMMVGLGNPGPEYAGHRHNAGFMAVEAIAHRHRFSDWKLKFHGSLSEGMLAGEKILLLRPLTFMNRSGTSVAEAANFYKIPPERIVVFHDELDLLPGKIRVKLGGGNGGHNGLKSIDAHMAGEYWRVRIGIGHPGDKDRVTGYVLNNFSQQEIEPTGTLLDVMAELATLLVEGKAEAFASEVARLTQPPKEKKEKKEKEPEDGI